MRLIDADALTKRLKSVLAMVENEPNQTYANAIRGTIRDVALAHTIDAEPVRHGRWRPYKQNVECSECHVKWAVDESIAVVYTSIKDLKYCPNCGARMRGECDASK